MNSLGLALALLFCAVLLTYANSFENAFHFDDFHTVTDNPAVRSLANLPRIFRDTTAFSVLPANQTYRPLVTASLALDYALGRGYVPFWFHLSTFVWFCLLIGLLFLWAESLFDKTDRAPENRWFALGLAAWFGLHPVMAETVNYVIQRGDLYCTLGCLAALVLYIRYPLGRRYGGYLLPFVLAMLSKPPASVFPVLLLLYVFFFETEGSSTGQRWWRSLRASLPAVACTAALLWLQSAMTPKSYAPSILPAAAYRLTQPYVWLRYTAALFLPLHLNVDTDLQSFATLNGAALLGLVFALALCGVIVLCARRRALYPIAYGLSWFLITQLPTSLYTLSEVENDHRMFFSFPGLMLAVIWALRLGYGRLRGRLRPISRRWLMPASAVGAGLLLCGYAFGAHRRNAVWHDEASLWADDAAKSPHNGRGLMIYGLTRMNAGDLAGAKALFEQALHFTPNYPTLEINLGVVNGLLADAGHPDLAGVAEQHYTRAIALAPGDDLPHAYYGRWLLGHGRVSEATQQLEIAVGLNRQREMQRDLLSQAYAKGGHDGRVPAMAQQAGGAANSSSLSGSVSNGSVQVPVGREVAQLVEDSLASYRSRDFAASVAEARGALQLDPRSAEAWNNLGAGYGALGAWDEGITAEEQALRLNPSLAIAANNLRWFQAERSKAGEAANFSRTERRTRAAGLVNESLRLNQAHSYRESRKAALQALALDPDSAEAWNNIAADEEAEGDWQKAIAAAQHALQLRPDFQLARNNLVWSLAHQHDNSKP